MFTTRNNPSSFEEHEKDPELSRDDAIEDLQPADQDAETVTGGGIWSTVKDATVMGAEKKVLVDNGMLVPCHCF